MKGFLPFLMIPLTIVSSAHSGFTKGPKVRKTTKGPKASKYPKMSKSTKYLTMPNAVSLSTSTILTSSPAILSWIQIGPDINGEAAYDYSGRSVSLSSDGTIVAIGASYNDGNGNQSGHVRVFQYKSDLSSWIQIGPDIDGEAAYDYSGRSVSLSSDGTTVAIGARYNDGNGVDSGHVRVFRYQSNLGSWIQIGSDIDGEAAYDYSGRSVSLSSDGTIVAIGSHGNDGNGVDSGHVCVFQYKSDLGSWIQIGSDIDGEAAYDYSGRSVSLSSDGMNVAIGSQYNDGNGNQSGHVRVFHYKSDLSSWIQIGPDIDGEAAYDESGSSVSLSSDGTIVAIGSHGNDGNGIDSGHVRVFQYKSDLTSWIQIGQDIDGEAAYDWSGLYINLSLDGTTVAIGATYNDDNGHRSGHVRVFRYKSDSNLWIKMGPDIDGEAAYDGSGSSVSLSSDGTIVAIGSHYNDGKGVDSGHVRVFKLV